MVKKILSLECGAFMCERAEQRTLLMTLASAETMVKPSDHLYVRAL